MKPYLSDSDFDLYVGDVRDVLRELPDGSVDCVVTSPPYWGLRDYGTGTWEGGDEGCDHSRPTTMMNVGFNERWGQGAGERKQERKSEGQYAQECAKCGARRVDRQIGLEPTPEEYVETMVEVFREVRRVLADHGTCWLNLGDSYASGEVGRVDAPTKNLLLAETQRPRADRRIQQRTGLKPKDLVGIPWRVAFALQADGWYLRSDVIWSKPNPMPESVTDRPTKAHEYVFLFAKSGDATYWVNPRRGTLSAKKPSPDYWWFPPPGEDGEPSETPVEGWERRNVCEGRSYFFDAEAVREPYIAPGAGSGPQSSGRIGAGGGAYARGRKPTRIVPQEETLDGSDGEAPRGPDGRRQTKVEGRDGSLQHRDGGRNIRTVWEIATQPYPEAHFATYPEKLVGRCLLAGCPEQVCRTCGKPREPIVNAGQNIHPGDSGRNDVQGTAQRGKRADGKAVGTIMRERHEARGPRSVEVSDCGHDNYRPGIILDPFLGSGTTAVVARRHGRACVGIELNEKYADLIEKRTHQLSLLADAA